MADASDDDSDDWATDELPDLPPPKKELAESSGDAAADDDGDWVTKLAPAPAKAAAPNQDATESSGEPMILVDMTLLSNDAIHSKFDPNAVNDPVAVKQLRTTIEQQYDEYHTNAELVANGTVIPCGSSVWRPALERMRRERSGHYFAPIFPPLKK